MNDEKSMYGNGYGKRPIWQWILLYVVIGAIVYAIIYYFVTASGGGYTSSTENTYTTPTSNISVPADNMNSPVQSTAVPAY